MWWKITLGVLGVIVLVSTGALFYLNYLVNKSFSSDLNRNIVEIKSGESTKVISEKLKSRGQIASAEIFLVYARLQRQPLQAGIYRITGNSSTKTVYDLIASGKVTHQKVTIPEGYRTEQIAQVFTKAGVTKYDDFMKAANGKEGQLFPDTYYLPLNIDAASIVAMMEADYAERVKSIKPTSQDLIIASIVEHEAVKDEERALIAGVFKNRITRGMKLEADPTIQYAKDTAFVAKLSPAEQLDFKFWGKITLQADSGIASPFNTYYAAGLPPAPICNPGLKSIQAAVNPEKHDYLYFLHKDGQIYPSKTEAEHNTNRAKVLGVKTAR